MCNSGISLRKRKKARIPNIPSGVLSFLCFCNSFSSPHIDSPHGTEQEKLRTHSAAPTPKPNPTKPFLSPPIPPIKPPSLSLTLSLTYRHTFFHNTLDFLLFCFVFSPDFLVSIEQTRPHLAKSRFRFFTQINRFLHLLKHNHECTLTFVFFFRPRFAGALFDFTSASSFSRFCCGFNELGDGARVCVVVRVYPSPIERKCQATEFLWRGRSR